MSDTAAPSTETTATPTPAAAAPPPSTPTPHAHEKRPSVVNTIKHGSVVATPEPRGGEVRTVRSSSEATPRSFTEHQKTMLANLDAHGDVRGVEKPAAAPAEPPAPEPKVPEVKPAAAPEVKQDPKPAAAATPAPAADPELTARAERLTEHNKRLVAELEKRTTSAAEPDERTKALDEIERGLTTDSMGSLRKLVALNAGVKDAASPDVDRLMSGIYAEWTAHELKMQMDPAQRAALGTERNRLLIERDKRERDAQAKTSETKAATEAQARRETEYVGRLDANLESAKHGEKFPLLMKHAKVFDQKTPAQLIFESVRRGIAAGEFTADAPDETLINHYSKAIEAHYQALRDHIVGAPPTSTATPAQPTVSATENKAGAPDTGARTITNASASVAPPAPPAKPTPPANDQPKPNRRGARNEERFRRELAQRLFGED